MQPKHFNMLAIAAVTSLIAAGVVHSSYNAFNDDVVSGERLFPSLLTQADAIGEVAIHKGEAKLTIKKSSDGKSWSLVERAGYPVDPKKVRALAVQLGQAELIEKKTRNKELYGQIDLGDPAAKGTTAKLVRLADAANQTIAEVVIGSQRRAAFGSSQTGTYVRVPGDPQTWFAKLELNASTDVVDWVEPAFFKIDDQKVRSMVVRDGDAVVYKLARAEKKKDEKVAGFELTDIPAGRKQAASLRVDDLITGLRTLEMKDVREARVADAKPDMTAEIEMDDGTRYRIGMKREDKQRWMTVAVVAHGKDDKGSKALAEATKGWAFEIPEWRVGQTFKKVDEIFEVVKLEPPKVSLPPTRSVVPAAPTPAPAASVASTPAPSAAPPATTERRPPEPADAAVQKP